MNAKKAKRMLIGTIVIWDGDEKDLGTIRKFGPGCFYVDWESGGGGWIDFYDAEKVSIY